MSGLLYQPVGVAADVPKACIMWFEGYSPPSAVGPLTGGLATADMQEYARRGFAGLYVEERPGTQVPAGEGLYYKYAEDGYDAVEWAASQDWCDNVGLVGASLDGISAWLPASLRPPSLKAIAPQIACGDCYWYLWNKGGTRPGAGREGRRFPATATDEYEAGAAHPTYDSWWEERNTSASEHAAMARSGIAVMQCGGWDDYIFAGGTRAIEQITAAGGQGMNVIGPCAHGGETPTLAPYDYRTHTVLWFDRFLKGIRNGIDTGPDALIYVQGADQYRYEQTWPPADTHWSTLHLRSARSGSATSRNDGSLSPVPPGAADPPVGYVHDPAGPLNDAGGGGVRPTGDQRPEEAAFLTWTTPALTTPTEITGWPRLSFWASSSAADTDFVAELTDVAPDGTSRTISRGWLNSGQAFSRSRPRALAPGVVHRFDLELWPLAYVVKADHRIRVALSGSDAPGTAVNPLRSTVRVFQDAARPSTLQLPVIGTGWRALEAQRSAASSSASTGGDARQGTGSAPPVGGRLPATGMQLLLPTVAAVGLLAGLLLRARRRDLLQRHASA